MYFHRPADVNKMAFLVHKHLDRDDDRWLYLPALDLVKRIAATDKRTSFVGSDFFYEDISGRHIEEDTHELLKTTQNYYVLKNTPKNPKSVEFSYFTMWIHRQSFVVVKTEYLDKQGQKYREYTAKEVKVIQGYPTVTRATMADLRTGGYTELGYSTVKYNLGVPESVFTERYLRRPPYKYLK
ncbi:MAG: outer membrane lipoprotein-sorting protein [Deltaproteobacteria bacterium]|nr:outer membrane lipoprotein-sorting protein [Deltaproteobacteria bacterium]